MSKDIEVYEKRLGVTSQSIVEVCDGFVNNRDLEFLSLSNIFPRWELTRRVYYATLSNKEKPLPISQALGYVEITQLDRYDKVGVRVRIVSTWPPMLPYWQELGDVVMEYFGSFQLENLGSKSKKPELPKGFPKTEKTKAIWKKMYKIIKRKRKEYLKAYENKDTRYPIPTLDDLRDAIFKETKIKRSAKTIKNIQKAGDDGLLAD